MGWRLLVFAGAVVLAMYRVRALRGRNVPVLHALGLGLDRRPAVDAVAGIAIGALAMAAVFAVEWLAGLLTVTGVASPGALLADLSTHIAVPLIEELVFRSAILGALLLLLRRAWVAVALSAVIFGGMHAANPHATVLSVVSTTAGGLTYGGAFAATERIWLSAGLHAGWNYSQARVFGFSISGHQVVGPPPWIQQHDLGPALLTGGAYGPEGGLIGLAARVLVIALVAAWLVNRGRLERLR